MKVKVLQWNIWYWEKIAHIIEQIKILNPDIICLQELSINGLANRNIHTANQIKAALGFYSCFKIAQRLNDDDDIGNGIFSRFPIKKTSSVSVQQPKEKPIDFTDEGRLYIEAEIDINNTRLTVGTTHLSYTHKFQASETKKKESNNLVNILKKKKNNYIFTGDLNAPPNSYTISEVYKYLVNLGPDVEQNTWTTKPFEYQGFKENKLNWRLDYVFGTKDIMVVSSKIVKTDYSDHLPILVTLNI